MSAANAPALTGRIVAAFGVPTSIIGPGCAHLVEYQWTDPDGVTGCTKCMTPLDDESEPGLWQYHHTMKINGFYEDALPPAQRWQRNSVGWFLSRWVA